MCANCRSCILPLLRFALRPVVMTSGCCAAQAIMSSRPKLLFEYFKQLFAQVSSHMIAATKDRPCLNRHVRSDASTSMGLITALHSMPGDESADRPLPGGVRDVDAHHDWP